MPRTQYTWDLPHTPAISDKTRHSVVALTHARYLSCQTKTTLSLDRYYHGESRPPRPLPSPLPPPPPFPRPLPPLPRRHATRSSRTGVSGDGGAVVGGGGGGGGGAGSRTPAPCFTDVTSRQTSKWSVEALGVGCRVRPRPDERLNLLFYCRARKDRIAQGRRLCAPASAAVLRVQPVVDVLERRAIATYRNRLIDSDV